MVMRVALTGGIASGKSSAADAFRTLQVPVIDTDAIARQLVEKDSPALEALVQAFGEEILQPDRTLDRGKLRQRIFANASDRERVNAILHPLILDHVDKQLAALSQSPHPPWYVVIEIPLLTETRLAATFDRVLVIDVPEDVQLERLLARDNVSREQAQAAVAAQASRQDRLKLATDVIDNRSDLAALQAAVRSLDEQYREQAKAFASPQPPRAE